MMLDHLTTVLIDGEEHLGIIDGKRGRLYNFVDFTKDDEIDLDILEASIIWRAFSTDEPFLIFVGLYYPNLLQKIQIKKVNAGCLKDTK